MSYRKEEFGIFQSLLKDGKNEQALHFIRDIVKNFPQSGIAWEHLGMLLAQLENYEEAIIALTHALELKSPSFFAYYYRAKSYAMTRHWQEAYSDCEKALTLQPASLQGIELKILILYQQQNFHEVLKIIEQCLENRVDSLRIRVIQCLTYQRLNLKKSALEANDHWLLFDRNDTGAWQQRFQLTFMLRQWRSFIIAGKILLQLTLRRQNHVRL